MESSAGGFLFTELSAQADDAFQRKVPVFPLEQRSCQFVTQYLLFGVSLYAEPFLPFLLPPKINVYVVHVISIRNLE